MFQWDAVDTSPDLGSQNLKYPRNLRNGHRHTRWTTRTELESFLSLDLFSLTFNNIFLAVLGGGEAIAPIAPPMDLPLLLVRCCPWRVTLSRCPACVACLVDCHSQDRKYITYLNAARRRVSPSVRTDNDFRDRDNYISTT